MFHICPRGVTALHQPVCTGSPTLEHVWGVTKPQTTPLRSVDAGAIQ